MLDEGRRGRAAGERCRGPSKILCEALEQVVIAFAFVVVVVVVLLPAKCWPQLIKMQTISKKFPLYAQPGT